jgi:transposase
LGLPTKVSRSTLAEANEKRDWRIYQDLAQLLLKRAKQLDLDLTLEGLDFDNPIYALDSSTVDLCLEVFWWAKFRKTKAAIKLHTLLDVRMQVPVFVHITNGKVHDVNVMDILNYEAEAFYVMDRGYLDWARLYRIHTSHAYFVTRAKKNLAFDHVTSRKVDKTKGLRCDQNIYLATAQGRQAYPQLIRRVKFFDEDRRKYFVFLTNNFEISALEVALLYKNRWKIELFFKWIKQHLDIKVFWGENQNAVKTQIWVAVCCYLMVKILKENLQIPKTMNEILQILSVSILDKMPISQLLGVYEIKNPENQFSNQLNIF